MTPRQRNLRIINRIRFVLSIACYIGAGLCAIPSLILVAVGAVSDPDDCIGG